MLVLQHDSISMLLTCCQSGIFDMSTRLRLAETRDAASRWVYQRADSKSWNPLVASDDDKARSGWLPRGYTTGFGGPAPALGVAGPPTDIARATLPSWPCTSRIVTVTKCKCRHTPPIHHRTQSPNHLTRSPSHLCHRCHGGRGSRHANRSVVPASSAGSKRGHNSVSVHELVNGGIENGYGGNSHLVSSREQTLGIA